MFIWWKRHRILLIITGICTGVSALLVWIGFGPAIQNELRLRDSVIEYGRKARPDPEVVFVAIDDASMQVDAVDEQELAASPALQRMKMEWPWSHDVYPLIIERLMSAGAKVVAFDLLFPTPRDTDGPFHDTLEKYKDHVVLGSNFGGSGTDRNAAGSSDPLMLPSSSLIPPSDPLDGRIGYVNFWPDWDQVIRSVHYHVTMEDVYALPSSPDSQVYESLAGRALELAGHADKIPKGRDAKLIRIVPPYKGDSDTGFHPISIYELFAKRSWEHPPINNGKLFQGKIVLIGQLGNWHKDEVGTPFGQIPGPTMHINAINAALRGDFLSETPRYVDFLLILLGGVSAVALSLQVRQPFFRFLLLLAGLATYYGIALGFYYYGIYIMLLMPMVAFTSSGFTWLVWEQVLDRLERLKMRRTLERYVSKNVVKEIVDNPSSFLNSMAGQRRPVSILFTDIRGFTTLTESSDSEQLVTQLNEFLTEMVTVVFENNGTVDKFIGDAVMAVWGNVHTDGPARDVELAVTAGLAMQAALKKLNAQWRERGIAQWVMGVGVNFGEVIVGNIGATGVAEKMEITVIGDSVNLASRLEGLSKPYHQEIIIGENAARLLNDRFHLLPVDFVTVIGKTKPIEIFTVLGSPGEPLDADTQRYLETFRKGMEHYQASIDAEADSQRLSFTEAERFFRESQTAKPEDWLAAKYIQRCEVLKDNPPGPTWDGAEIMETK